MAIKFASKSVSLGLCSHALRSSAFTAPIEELLDAGKLINVTGWSNREMGFAKEDTERVHVAMTARLIAAVLSIPKGGWFYQTTRGRGGELLWLAGRALVRARKLRGEEQANCLAVLPTLDDEEEDAKVVHVEYLVSPTTGKSYVAVGFPEEFPIG